MAMVGDISRLLATGLLILLASPIVIGQDEESTDPAPKEHEQDNAASDQPENADAEPEQTASEQEQVESENSDGNENVPYKRLPLQGRMAPNQNVDLPQDI